VVCQNNAFTVLVVASFLTARVLTTAFTPPGEEVTGITHHHITEEQLLFSSRKGLRFSTSHAVKQKEVGHCQKTS